MRWFVVESIDLEMQDNEVSATGVRKVLSPPVGVVSRQSTDLLLQERKISRRLVPFSAHHFLGCPPLPVLPAIQEPLSRFLSFASSLLKQPSTSADGRSGRAGILLKGPRGCGKRTLARHACQQLGFHYKEIDGLAVSQGASGRAAAAGSAASHVDGSFAPGTNSLFSAALVDAASEATPVLIYIRRVHMLYRNTGGEAPTQADMNRLQARLACHLRWFLTDHSRWMDNRLERGRPAGTALLQMQLGNDCGDKIVLVVASLETETDETSEGSNGEAKRESLLVHDFLETFDLVIPLKRPDKVSLELVARQLTEAIQVTDEACGKPILQVSSTEVAEMCTGLVADDVHSLFYKVLHEKAEALMREQTLAIAGRVHPREACTSPSITPTMTAADFRRAVKAFRSDTVDNNVPSVQWQDVGGIERAKEEIRDYISLPLERPELFEGLKTRGGILLFGPPGTGKTLLAKAVATECGVNFISVKGPELLNMYIGESEKNVRKVFQKARACRPSVLFFDELDALLPRRGRTSDSAGVLDRIVAQLLAELDGLPNNVFVIGATNRIELIDKAVMRAGRLDRCVYIGIQQNRMPLLEALTRHMTLEETFEVPADPSPCTQGTDSVRRRLLDTVNSLIPPQFTGADCKGLCSVAGLLAAKEKINFVNAMSETLNIPAVELQDLLQELEISYSPDIQICFPTSAKRTGTCSSPFPLRCRLPLEQQASVESQLRLVLAYDRSSSNFTRSRAGIRESFQVWNIVRASGHEPRPPDLHPTFDSTAVWCISTMTPEDLMSFVPHNTLASEMDSLPEFVLEPSSTDDRHPEADGPGGQAWRNCGWLLNGRRAFLWKPNCSNENAGLGRGRAVGKSENPSSSSTTAIALDVHRQGRVENGDPTTLGIQKGTSTESRICLVEAVVLSGPPPHELLKVRVGERHFRAALAQTRPSLSSHDLRHYEKMKRLYESVHRPE
uniref:Peroxisomal ATPase PEX6 n=1 Tax=Neospora caninum (strain Liverpool) TaxID=572307 RepID=A0A0F7UB55_NEOCL|nr:TPA: peroxisomal-type ATPase, putative [Neospora caninum Liverpool]